MLDVISVHTRYMFINDNKNTGDDNFAGYFFYAFPDQIAPSALNDFG